MVTFLSSIMKIWGILHGQSEVAPISGILGACATHL